MSRTLENILLLICLCVGIIIGYNTNINAMAETSPTSITQRIETLESEVKALTEKNAELEERLDYMGDSLGTTVELVDRLEAKVGM